MADEALPGHGQPAIEPDTDRTDDEGFQESSTSSLLSSIASEIKQGKVENGRRYANYGQHEYALPNDDDELDRLDLNHSKYHLLQGDKHYLAPIGDNPQSILDVGTGTGIWAIDMADLFPSASVIGTDIAPIQPQWVPQNCQFQIDDAEQTWTFAPASFDFIYCRDMYTGIRDWPKFVHQCYQATKPGGWVEFASVYPIPFSDDGTLPRDAGIVELATSFDDISRSMGADPDFPKKWKGWFEATGFEGVVQRVYKIPSSPWPKDRRLKKVGAFEYMNICEGAAGFLLRGWSKEFGQTREELEILIMRMRKELASNKFHCYVPFYSVYGRKPMSYQPED